MQKWEVVEGNLATPRGFRAAAVAAGIKKVAGALDVALIVSDAPDTVAAGVFTTNVAAAAPVLLSRQNLRTTQGHARAVIVNAGNANACTGRAGLRAAQETTRAVAQLLGIAPKQVLVASTGVIGVPLKHELILNQLPNLKEKLSIENASAVAQAIMTTDTFPKCCVLRTEWAGKPVHLAGVAKGAGMIQPRMATMLSFLTTDAAVAPALLQKMLRAAADVSFNCVTVDGDTSTNDTLLLLASGLSQVVVKPKTRIAAHFQAGLTQLCETLARLIAKDGEGAKKLVTVEVCGAKTSADCRAHRAQHCQFAAGQDRHRRERPQLGTHPLRGGLFRRQVRPGQGRYFGQWILPVQERSRCGFRRSGREERTRSEGTHRPGRLAPRQGLGAHLDL